MSQYAAHASCGWWDYVLEVDSFIEHALLNNNQIPSLNNHSALNIGSEAWASYGLFPLLHTVVFWKNSLKRFQDWGRSVFLCFVLFSPKLVTRTKYTASKKECYPSGVNRYINTNCVSILCIMKGKIHRARDISGKNERETKNSDPMEERLACLQGGNGKIKAVGFRLTQRKH